MRPILSEFEDPLIVQLSENRFILNANTKICILSNDIEYLDAEDYPLNSCSQLNHLLRLRILNISSSSLKNLIGIEELINLEILWADFCEFSDLSPLSSLKKLRSIDFTCNSELEDISPLSQMTSLRRLYLAHTEVSQISVVFLGILILIF